MKKVDVPLTLMGKRFVFQVSVKTIEDYESLIEGEPPETRQKLEENIAKHSDPKALQGRALILFFKKLCGTLNKNHRALVWSELAELAQHKQTLVELRNDDPTLFEKTIAELDRNMQWHQKLVDLLSLAGRLEKTADVCIDTV